MRFWKLLDSRQGDDWVFAMKFLPLTLVILFSVFAMSVGPGQAAAQELGKDTKHLAATGRVLQVLPAGLLFSGGAAPYLIVGHPNQKTMADGDAVNCYVEKTDRTFEYTDTQGAKRTVRVFRYLTQRIGKR